MRRLPLGTRRPGTVAEALLAAAVFAVALAAVLVVVSALIGEVEPATGLAGASSTVSLWLVGMPFVDPTSAAVGAVVGCAGLRTGLRTPARHGARGNGLRLAR